MSLSSLPVEILHEVLQYVETDEDLYNLGLTCKHTHRTAFSAFLKRHKVDDPTTMRYHFSAYEYSPLLLPIIQGSLWITDIRHFTCGINPGYHRIWKDVGDLTNIVKKMRSIETMRLGLGQMDAWTRANTSQVLDEVKWAKCVTALLDAVIERGCLTLDIDGGDALKRLYIENANGRDNIQTRGARKSTKESTFALKKMVPKIFGRFKKPLHPYIALTSPRLRSVILNRSLMFHASFYPWTLKMFSQNSSTITRLSLNCFHLPTETTSQFLSSITLPQLNYLDITTFLWLSEHHLTTTHTVMFCDLVSFFGRHPSIEILDLQGVERPKSLTALVLETSILPRLKRVVAHPIWISTLVGSLDMYPDAFTLLETIGITTEYNVYSDLSDEDRTYELINDALRKIGQASFARPITLELQLTTKRGMLKWFDEHSSLGNEGSIISSLSSVSALVLTTRFYVCFGREEVYHLPEWLALFPELRSVSMTDPRQENDGYRLIDDKPLLNRIAVECPMLEIVNTVNLGTLLDGTDSK
ncbi:hypothetical protein CPB83DRAFT_904724, partial [Crepidotus variabilis]